ncbi:MAG: NADPH-dependent FMN reductase [Nocardioidaceae bacterium]
MSLSPEVSRGGVITLVGNPVKGSRTSAVAQVVAAGLGHGPGHVPEVIELADHGSALFSYDDDRAARARELVSGAHVLVVATPVFKAGYTGLLKLFLDSLDPTALESTVAVPVILTASSAHGAMADLQLRLVLQAVGALLPVPSFVLEEHHLDHLPQYVEAWQGRFGPAVAAVSDALRPREVTV